MLGRPPDGETTRDPQITSREVILTLDDYRVVAYRYDTAQNVYIVEYKRMDALGEPSWREMRKLTPEPFGLSEGDFLYNLFLDLHEGVT